MKSRSILVSGVALLFVLSATLAADTKDEAIKKDRKKYEGTWQLVSMEEGGVKADEADIKNITVVNEANGKWAIKVGDTIVSQGTSEIDPTKKLRTVDLTIEGEGKGQKSLGIYQFEDDDTRKVCLANPEKARPTEFSSSKENGHILAVFKRVKK